MPGTASFPPLHNFPVSFAPAAVTRVRCQKGLASDRRLKHVDGQSGKFRIPFMRGGG